MKKVIVPHTDPDWQKQFKEFMSAETVAPPLELSRTLISKVRDDLDPNIWWIFGKIVGIGACVGTLSLLICPQFGYGSDIGIMRFFMQLGPLACRTFCGAFFMASCMFCSAVTLSQEEQRKVQTNRWLLSTSLSLLALAIFSCTSPVTFEAAGLLWFLGATIGGLLAFETGYFVSRWILRAT